jgi:Rod binding domain-containing protein
MTDMVSGDVALVGAMANFDPAAGKAVKDTPENIAKAATQFEALLIGQLLKSARDSGEGGWFGTDGDEAGSTLTEMSEQQLSSAMASSGGLGLAKMIQSGLTKTVEQKSRSSNGA